MLIYCLFVNDEDPTPMATFIFEDYPTCAQLKERVGRYLKSNSSVIASYVPSEIFECKYDDDSPIPQILDSFIPEKDDEDDSNSDDLYGDDGTDSKIVEYQISKIKYLIDELSVDDVYDLILGNRKLDCGLTLTNITNTIYKE